MELLELHRNIYLQGLGLVITGWIAGIIIKIVFDLTRFIPRIR